MIADKGAVQLAFDNFIEVLEAEYPNGGDLPKDTIIATILYVGYVARILELDYSLINKWVTNGGAEQTAE